jgi:hypothetical protein
MNRFLVIILSVIAVALATTSPVQARDHHYRSSHYSHSYSRGYCAPRYYSSYNYCPPTYYRSYYPPTYYRSSYCAPRYYSGYSGYCAPRYYSSPCYSSGIRIGLPGIGIFFGR